MAVQRFKISLNAARFPLVSTKGGRAVFIPGLDSAPRTPRQFVGTDESVDYNTAQVLYGENFMPAAEGLVSVGFVDQVPASIWNDFDSIFPLRDAEENNVLYSPAKGRNYTLTPGSTTWTPDPWQGGVWSETVSVDSTNTPETATVTYAYVDGKTFVCYSRIKGDPGGTIDMSLMYWRPDELRLDPATLLVTNKPFAPGTIDGVSSSNGFLLLWSDLTIAWAKFNGTSFDFLPYANGAFTGSGAQIPEDIQGPITAVIGTAGGCIIFTARNAIAAHYNSQNLVAPWTFREIPNAGGVGSYEQVTVEGSLSTVYAYTTAGMQRISLNSAESIFAEVSDFIAGRNLESFNLVSNVLTPSYPTADLFTKVTNIGNRFIVISYGTVAGYYDYALIYDMVLERFGKFRAPHTDCFNYSYVAEPAGLRYSDLATTPYSAMGAVPYDDGVAESKLALIAAQHSIGFMLTTGLLYVADWSIQSPSTRGDNGVAIIGRVQLSRSRFTQINRVEIENLYAGTVWIVPSYDGGTNATAQQLVDVSFGPGVKIFGGLIDCKNFLLIVKGRFDLSTIIIEAIPTGQN